MNIFGNDGSSHNNPIHKADTPHKAQTNTPSTGRGTTVLHLAAEHGRTEVVRTLLQLHMDIDGRDATGSTALQLAAARGHGEVVQRLVYAHATLDIEDDAGYTALQLAAMNGHAEVVQVLVSGGAVVD